jgi:hypothetical protein
MEGVGDESAFKWSASDFIEGDEGDRVGMVHPVFVLPCGDAERMRSWFVKKGKGVNEKV